MFGKVAAGVVDNTGVNADTSCTHVGLRSPVHELGRRRAAGRSLAETMFMKHHDPVRVREGHRRSITALTTEKIAVFTPMPSVSAAIAASVNAGLCANIRSECFRSLKMVSIMRG